MFYRHCPKCGSVYSQKELKDFLKNRNKLSCEECGFVFYNNPKPTVAAIIKNKENKILFTKRSIKPYFGWWDLPGGFINYGENPEEALSREIREELGVDIKIKKIIGVFSEFYKNLGRHDEEYSLIVLVYLIDLENRNIVVGDDVAMYKFFSLNKLPERIAFSGLKRFFKTL